MQEKQPNLFRAVYLHKKKRYLFYTVYLFFMNNALIFAKATRQHLAHQLHSFDAGRTNALEFGLVAFFQTTFHLFRRLNCGITTLFSLGSSYFFLFPLLSFSLQSFLSGAKSRSPAFHFCTSLGAGLLHLALFSPFADFLGMLFILLFKTIFKRIIRGQSIIALLSRATETDLFIDYLLRIDSFLLFLTDYWFELQQPPTGPLHWRLPAPLRF